MGRSAAGVTLQLAQLILGSLQLGPERPNFILQPLNVGGTALIGGRQLAIVLQRGELVSKLVAKQHSPFGAGEVDALFVSTRRSQVDLCWSRRY